MTVGWFSELGTLGLRRRGDGQTMACDDEGQAIVWFAVAMPLVLMLIVLVVDGGQLYLAYIRARNAAELAAQAGAQSVDESVFRQTNEVVLNIDGSLWTMRQYMVLNSGARQGRISTSYVGHTAYAQVCTQTMVPTLFFRLFGADALPVGACARAYPAHGIRHEGE
jgi:Flp pilus assembly protein TadG